MTDAERLEVFESGRRAGLKQGAKWCGSQASALHKLNREDAARAAFVEAHNALLALAEGRA